MRTVVILGLKLGLGLVLTLLAAPAATAGTLADYKAQTGEFKLENGVRVYRVQLAKPQAYLTQNGAQVTEAAYERGYQEGFETGLSARQKKVVKSRKRRQTGRSRYNYGRRYSTSGANPRYNRFRSNISYGRPAYIALTKEN